MSESTNVLVTGVRGACKKMFFFANSRLKFLRHENLFMSIENFFLCDIIILFQERNACCEQIKVEHHLEETNYSGL